MDQAHPDSMRTPVTQGDARRRLAWFAVWLVVGAALAFSVLDGVAFGFFLFPFAVAAVVLLIVRHRLDRSAWGLLCGVGLLSLYVAYVERKGPGTVYWHTATASGYDTYPDPRPWFVAGLLLIVVGVTAFVWHRRRLAAGQVKRQP